MRLLLAAFALVLVLPVTEASARKKVRIYKPSPLPANEVQYPMAVVPPVLIAFDLARRTQCEPRELIAAGTGKGDPGFDPKGPTTGNFLVPAIYRSQCGGYRPKWYKW